MPSDPECSNLLLRALSSDDFALLAPSLSRQPLDADRVLERCGARVSHAWFVENGIVSVSAQSEGCQVEVHMIGLEGMTGASLLLDEPCAAYHCRVRAAGEGLCIPAPALRAAAAASRTLRAQLLRHVHAMMMETALTALCSACGTVEMRLARWLLMTQDREGGHVIAITHDVVAAALGARRASVTGALHLLEGKRLLKSTRGAVAITDRAGLAAMCGGMYRPLPLLARAGEARLAPSLPTLC
ncbi:MAG TPA: Crp/Fnr family transcriptional regulator [Mesorhizobium sp.]|nr:Crp/Fnr family transcriptional regulator [Mesorhizobium sp.]